MLSLLEELVSELLYDLEDKPEDDSEPEYEDELELLELLFLLWRRLALCGDVPDGADLRGVADLHNPIIQPLHAEAG